MATSFAGEILRTAVRHRRRWIIEQLVLVAIALVTAALSETWLVVFRIFGVYLGVALYYAGHRGWKELEATYRRQALEIERLTENALSHAGDLAEAERRQRFFYEHRLSMAKGDFRMTAVVNRRSVDRMQSEVERRSVEIVVLQKANATLREENEALRLQVIEAASARTSG